MLHNWCFEDKYPTFNAFGIKFSVSLYTDTNRYDLDPKSLKSSIKNNSQIFKCSLLIFAGGQMSCKANVEVRVEKVGESIKFKVDAEKYREYMEKNSD